MRCAIYSRVSTDKQDNQNQLTQLRDFANAAGWDIVQEYVDVVSGGKAAKLRPQFDAMMTAASQRRFDALLFWSLDRFSREGALPTLKYLAQLNEYGVVWRSYTEQYLDTTGMFKDAVVSILAVVAKQEKARIQERTKAGLATARRKGVKLGRPRVHVDPVRVRKLRAQGLTWPEIAKRLSVCQSLCERAIR
jgi:DNA invertase Pin-like site-specific DNA recombinase